MKTAFNITKIQVSDDRTNLEHYNESNYFRVFVNDFKTFRSIALATCDGVVEIPYDNIPVLIAMLQSVNSGVK